NIYQIIFKIMESEKKEIKEIEQRDKLLEQFVHPYFDEEPDIEKDKFVVSDLVSRGCSKEPISYRPVSKKELDNCSKMNVHNWMGHIHSPSNTDICNVVEVRFKNSRKDFYRLPEGLEISEGDVVAVEGNPGHDIGIVTLSGELCRIQMKKRKLDLNTDFKRLYRRAKAADIEKWLQSVRKEDGMIFKTRDYANRYNLKMKVNDVEFQGDGTKAIFYYTADERVDFRQLIKSLAEEFKVRIEMKQIGARQEASRLGGIGTCGRELCCSTWLNTFNSVSTVVAKTQQLFPNPQKLAGQCGKLKCCLNYEYDVYVESLNKIPELGVELQTEKGVAVYHKVDVFKRLFWYSYQGSTELFPLSAETVKSIIEKNKRNIVVKDLETFAEKLDNEKSSSKNNFNENYN
ncbi:MAG: regulatory iron-sulfur-containing complex subunit RicT, partial [Bacteroidales bacterium]|nr:regulatory iron-sulfur-containing complex subunit RicT [Bacteroidales bacterium]